MPDIYALSEWVADDSGTRRVSVADDYPTPLGWSDVTGQPDADILDGYDVCVVIGRISDAQWTALQADARYPALVASGTLTAQQVAALRDELAAVVHPDVAKLATQQADAATIRAALVDANTRPVWRPGMSVKRGDVLYYERNLIEVLADHVTAAHWKPGEAHSLYKRYFNPDGEPEPWVQPISAETAYPLGFRVLYLDRIWISQIPANTTVPGSDVRWWVLAEGQEPIPDPDVTPEWVSGEQLAYSAQTPVYRMYQGVKYQLRQSPGANIWIPPSVPALWLVVPT